MDANLDGADDVVIYKTLDPVDPLCSCHHQWRLELYLNSGPGTFGPPQTLLSTSNQITGMASEDFLGTAARDLCVTVSNGDIHLFASAPVGLQGPSTTSIAPLAISKPAIADFDLDGERDLASPAWPAGAKLEWPDVTDRVVFLRNTGAGPFRMMPLTINVQNFAQRARASDLNSDDRPDLLIEHMVSGVSLFPNLSTPPNCPADANADLLVDGRDLSLLLSTFGESSVPGRGADLNVDGTIDGADLAALLSQFGISCE